VFETPADKFLFSLHGLDADQLPGKHQRHEHGLAIVMRQAVTAVHELFNSNVQL